MRTRALLIVSMILLTGCLTQTPPSATPGPVDQSSQRPVVIALLDTGTNPYLPIFESTNGNTWAPPGAAVHRLATHGTFSERAEQDASIWASITPRTVHAFEGKRLAVMTYYEPDEVEMPVANHGDHGTIVSYAAANESRDAFILLIQVPLGGIDECNYSTTCFIDPRVAEALAWAADQPWIDVVSTSIGFIGNPPEDPRLHPEMGRWLRASERAVQNGKIVLAAGGNNALPSTHLYQNGPPWVISVGGAEPDRNAEHYSSAKGGIDVMSNMSIVVAAGESLNESVWASGTSFASPAMAGVLAQAIHLIRTQAPGRAITPHEVREALNASAIYFDALDWDPRPGDPTNITGLIEHRKTLPILAQPQMGWGYANSTLSPEIARRVLEQDFTIEGKDQAKLYQPAWQQAREDFWAQYQTS